MDAGQEAVLRIRAEGAMFRDSFAGPDGMYSISSLYFDDPEDTCFYDSLDGVGRRAKYRIRIYNGDTGFIRLEKKLKKDRLTGKLSCSITKEQCEELMMGIIPYSDEPLIEELRLACVRPSVIVSYERIPYVYPAGNVRLTFDRNIESSTDVKSFLSGPVRVRPVLPAGTSVMELKWDDILPAHIPGVFQTEGLRWTHYSKYCMCRAYQA